MNKPVRYHRWKRVKEPGYSRICRICGMKMLVENFQVIGFETAAGTFIKRPPGGRRPPCAGG